jgi:hypothetical protein
MKEIIVNDTRAAEILRTSTSTIRRWRWKDYKYNGPPYFKFGRAIRYRIKDLHKFMRDSYSVTYT